jgi:hypothetical protein
MEFAEELEDPLLERIYNPGCNGLPYTTAHTHSFTYVLEPVFVWELK